MILWDALRKGAVARSIGFSEVGITMPGLLLVFGILVTGDLEAQSLAKKHEANALRIHSISVAILSQASKDGGKTWSTLNEFSVRRSGQRERIHRKQWNAYKNEKMIEAPSFGEILANAQEERSLVGFGVTSLPKEPINVGQMELDDKRISGQISPASPFTSYGYKGVWSTFALLTPMNSTLSEFLQASGDVHPLEEKDEKNNSVWKLKLLSPRTGTACEVTISPAFGYAISKVILYDKKGDIIENMGIQTVKEFREIKPGLFLPVEIESRASSDGSQPRRVLFQNYEVNEPIPDTEFQLTFPNGIIVKDTRDGIRYHIWKEGKPEQTFKEPSELNKWMREKKDLAKAGGAQQNRIWRWVVLAIGGFLPILMILWARRKVASRLA